MGEVEVERVTAEDIPPENTCSPCSPNSHHASPNSPACLSNQQRDDFAVPSDCPGGDGLEIVGKKETF